MFQTFIKCLRFFQYCLFQPSPQNTLRMLTLVYLPRWLTSKTSSLQSCELVRFLMLTLGVHGFQSWVYLVMQQELAKYNICRMKHKQSDQLRSYTNIRQTPTDLGLESKHTQQCGRRLKFLFSHPCLL